MRRKRWAVILGRPAPPAIVGIARFELRAVVVTILASAVILAAFPASTPAVHAAEPKVVIVVGPVGSRTDDYRDDGDKAAKAARAAGATVEKIYSPEATWPRVRDALQGASLVVYLGHGNGWPSKYRDAPWPKTQNGMGLNPQAGGGDSAHQYFGERYLARDVRLAPHAVVLLSHLCYASGNSEPGLPEGDLAIGQQRVDNYAAGWLAAGAEAVVAEGFGSPDYYVRRILAGDGTIETIWRRAPTANGHVLAFPSERTPGMTALMDPTHKSSGFYRSLVGRIEMRAEEVARGAAGVTPSDGTLRSAGAGLEGPGIKDVTLKGIPTAGSSLRVTLELAKADREAAKSLGIGIRWDPLSLDPTPTAIEDAGPAASRGPATTAEAVPAASPVTPAASPVTPATSPVPPAASPVPPAAAAAAPPLASPDPPGAAAPSQAGSLGASAPSLTASPGIDPSPSPGASPDADAGDRPEAPPITLISPEIPGALVAVSDVKVKGARISADVDVPLEPGLYRLSVTVHDPDGIAFDAGVQERIPAFTVRVTGELSTVVSAIDRLSVAAAAGIELPVSVANTGRVAWVIDQDRKPLTGGPARPESDEPSAELVGQWVRLDGSGVAMDTFAARAMIRLGPGETEDVVLSLSAPSDPGAYLLVLDVISPLHGSLAAIGGSPMVVRVEVTSPEAEGASGGRPADRPGDTPPARLD